MDKTAHLLLRLGVAFAFLYPAVSAISAPDSWVGYFPQFLLASGIPSAVLLHAFGAVEAALALWILSGRSIFWPSALATAMLVAIVLVNFSQMEVLFRDLSIAAASMALAVDAYSRRNARHAVPSQSV